MEMGFVRGDRQPWLAVVPAEELFRLVASAHAGSLIPLTTISARRSVTVMEIQRCLELAAGSTREAEIKFTC